MNENCDSLEALQVLEMIATIPKCSCNTSIEDSSSRADLVLVNAGLGAFTVFSNLPTELRLKIWRFALPDPRLVDIRFWKEEVVHVEYTSKAGELSTTLLLVCKESKGVFHRNYKPSTIVLSATRTSRLNPPRIVPEKLVQHGYIDLERDVLQLDPNTIDEFLLGFNLTMVMGGLKAAASRINIWNDELILHRRLGESAFPSLKHLSVVLGEVEAEIGHMLADCSDVKSSSFSIVSYRPVDDSTIISGTLFFEISKTLQEESDRVATHGANIQTATFIANNTPCSWTFFLVQESYLLARATERMLEHNKRGKEHVDDILERITELLGDVRRLNDENTQMFATGRTRAWRAWIMCEFTLSLACSNLLCAGVLIYRMWSSTR
jgi:hypothetical protein